MGGILAVAAGQITAETMVFIALTALFVVMTFVGIFAMKSDKEKAKRANGARKRPLCFSLRFLWAEWGPRSACGNIATKPITRISGTACPPSPF